MFKKTTYLLGLILLITSCADTMDSVKRGLTGSKKHSTEEFLVQKKDPLILPPDYESLPLPSDVADEANEEIFVLEKELLKKSSDEITSSKADSNEISILQQIRKK